MLRRGGTSSSVRSKNPRVVSTSTLRRETGRERERERGRERAREGGEREGVHEGFSLISRSKITRARARTEQDQRFNNNQGQGKDRAGTKFQ